MLFGLGSVWLTSRIAGNAGLPRWWAIVAILPPLHLLLIWIIAFSAWPSVEGRAPRQPGASGPVVFGVGARVMTVRGPGIVERTAPGGTIVVSLQAGGTAAFSPADIRSPESPG